MISEIGLVKGIRFFEPARPTSKPARSEWFTYPHIDKYTSLYLFDACTTQWIAELTELTEVTEVRMYVPLPLFPP